MKEYLKNCSRFFNGLQKAQKNWNIADFHKYRDKLENISKEMPRRTRDYLDQSDNNMAGNQKSFESASYQEDLEEAMRLKELPFEGEFPNYAIGPFKLEVAIPKHIITFKFGRKLKRLNFLEPNAVANAISSDYRKIVKRPFNADRFAKDLLEAYEVANRLIHRDKIVQWGNVVSLKELYRLLTLRAASRREYSENQYIYDLSLFRQSNMRFNGHCFELGTSREVGRTYLLIDPDSKREVRVSSLTIYKED
ncbi:hypothetical protein J7L48_04710 [bacterium]|nr:hypothetical protein [bacterium]